MKTEDVFMGRSMMKHWRKGELIEFSLGAVFALYGIGFSVIFLVLSIIEDDGDLALWSGVGAAIGLAIIAMLKIKLFSNNLNAVLRKMREEDARGRV